MREQSQLSSSQAAYDHLWTRTWGDMQRFGPVHRHQREELLKLVARFKPNTVLDVGCGSGENLAALAVTFPELQLFGVDVSNTALAQAARLVPTATLRHLDAQTETLERRFDLVISMQVIEHLADDVSALQNMARMASHRVLVTTMRGRMRPSERLIGHFRNYSDTELREKADRAGLQVIDIFGWGFPFYSPLFRTAVEWLPSQSTKGELGGAQKLAANILYHLYRFNIPRRGDVVTMLARPRDTES